MIRPERILRFLLRYMGSVCLLALIAVFIPYAWMDAAHRWLGMGMLPKEPIVGYLTRSASLLYAFLGALMWLCSFDLARHRQVILFVGIAFIVFGAGVFGIDVAEGLPSLWKFAEGPVVIFWGVLMTIFARRVNARAA
jgi:hypothetical protein